MYAIACSQHPLLLLSANVSCKRNADTFAYAHAKGLTTCVVVPLGISDNSLHQTQRWRPWMSMFLELYNNRQETVSNLGLLAIKAMQLVFLRSSFLEAPTEEEVPVVNIRHHHFQASK